MRARRPQSILAWSLALATGLCAAAGFGARAQTDSTLVPVPMGAILPDTLSTPEVPTPFFGVIAGRITDAGTKLPLAYCTVRLDSTSYGAISDRAGRFLIPSIPPGTYRMTVTRIDHRRGVVENVSVQAGDTTRVDVALETVTLTTEPVVVTASRTEQTARAAPASVDIVNQEDIQKRAPTTFDQSIEAVAGLNAYRSTGISVQGMQIRGSSDVAGGGVGNRVLLLIDGRPALLSDTGGAFWSLVPTQFIDHVEIVKGAFSSLYGSTAMGGVVNVITRRPSSSPVGKLEFKMGFFEAPPEAIRYTEETLVQSEVTADVSGSVGSATHGLRYLLSASRKDSDGFSENTAYSFYDLFGKLIYDISGQRKLELTVGGGRAENDYPHAWLSGQQPLEVRDAFADDRQEKDYSSVDLLYWGLTGETRYSTRAYWYRHEQNSFFNDGDPNQSIPGNEPFGLETDIQGDKVGAITQVDFNLGQRDHLVTGFDVQLDHVESGPDSILYGDRQINNYAVFAQDDVTLGSSVTVNLGARYDWNHLVSERTLEQLSPKVGVVWKAGSAWTVRGLFAQAFRAPTVAELYTQRELGGGIAFLPNPDLEAERIVASYELGVRWQATPRVELDAAVFRYDYEDLMYYEEISDELGVGYPIYQVRNLNDALMQGVELGVNWRWQGVGAYANYTWLDARDQSPGREDDLLPYRPEHTANVGADVAWKRWALHGDARFRSRIEEVFLYPKQAPAEYWVLNANLQFRVSSHIGVSAKCNNLTDAIYDELARYRMPGRNWLFGVTLGL